MYPIIATPKGSANDAIPKTGRDAFNELTIEFLKRNFQKGGDVPAGTSWQTRRFAPPFSEISFENQSRACHALLGDKKLYKEDGLVHHPEDGQRTEGLSQ
jgi:hypothetical protein